MNVVKKYRRANRRSLVDKAVEISKSDSKEKKRFTFILKSILIPIYAVSKIIQWVFKIPMYICCWIGSVFEWLDESTEDFYHILEDIVFLVLYKVFKFKEDD